MAFAGSTHRLFRIVLAFWLFIGHALATGGLNGLPVLNGPINPTNPVLGMKTRVGDFIHPGLWHTHDDLERIRLGVKNGQEPWKSAFVNFSTDPFSSGDVSHYSIGQSLYDQSSLTPISSMSYKDQRRSSAEDHAAITRHSRMTCAQAIKIHSCGTSQEIKAIGTRPLLS